MALSTHRPYRPAIRRRWPRAEFLGGSGPWATVSTCPPVVSVELHVSQAAATRTLSFIGQYGCGHACRRQHAVYDLLHDGGAR